MAEFCLSVVVLLQSLCTNFLPPLCRCCDAHATVVNKTQGKKREKRVLNHRIVSSMPTHVCVEEMYVNRHFFGEVDVGQMVSSSLVLQILASQCIMCSTAKELESPMP